MHIHSWICLGKNQVDVATYGFYERTRRCMLTNKQNIHTALSPPEKISILLVSPHADDRSALQQILQHGAWFISLCATVSDALPLIRSLSPPLVICERELADGNWKTVLDACGACTHPPLVLVTSRHADETLWAEVLNLGGYDVLLKPFDRREVTRVIGMAWRHWFGHATKQPVSSASPNPMSAQYA
jgi:DNA-binding response OmpR family regulator